MRDNRLARRSQEATDPIDDPQHQEHRKRDRGRDDLVLRQARDQQPYGNEAAAHQNQTKIRARNRLPLRVGFGEPEQDHHVDERQREHAAVESHRTDELAEDDLGVGDRRGQEQLDGSRPLLFGVRAHGDGREQEQHNHGRIDEHWCDQHRAHVHDFPQSRMAPTDGQ